MKGREVDRDLMRRAKEAMTHFHQQKVAGATKPHELLTIHKEAGELQVKFQKKHHLEDELVNMAKL